MRRPTNGPLSTPKQHRSPDPMPQQSDTTLDEMDLSPRQRIQRTKDVLALQRQIGNRATVQRLALQRQSRGVKMRRSANVIQRHEGGEHMYLGDEGYKAALEAYIAKAKEGAPPEKHQEIDKRLREEFGTIMQRKDQYGMSYGAGVGLGGDIYGSADEMYNDKNGWVNNTDVKDVISLFEDERKAATEEGKIGEDYEHSDVRLWWNAEHFIDLAKQNTSHFVGHNLGSYLKNHAQALTLAAQAKAETDEAKKKELWNKACFYNSFADHYLTDSFSSGHMRVPREEIMQFFAQFGYSDEQAGLISKVLHDYDNHNGLYVRNARGDRWKAFGDKMLHADKSQDKEVREAYQVEVQDIQGNWKATGKSGKDITIEAVKMSVTELLTAYDTGNAVAQNTALQLIPYPDPERQKQGLEDVFSPDNPQMTPAMRKKLLGELGMAGSLSGMNDKHLDLLIRNLPRLMKNFHDKMQKRFEAGGDLSAVPKTLQEGVLQLGSQGANAKRDAAAVLEILDFIKRRPGEANNAIKELSIILQGNTGIDITPQLFQEMLRTVWPANHGLILNALKGHIATWDYGRVSTVLQIYLKGWTTKQDEHIIMGILEALSPSMIQQIKADQNLKQWLDSDLTGADYKRFKEMVK